MIYIYKLLSLIEIKLKKEYMSILNNRYNKIKRKRL